MKKQLRLIDLKHHIDYFSKGQKSSRTDRTQKKRPFQVNSILSFHHTDKHEAQHVGQWISKKGTFFNSVPFYAYQPDIYFLVAKGPMLLSRVTAHKITNFRCKYLATMATGDDDDDDDDEDGATTTTMTTMTTMQRVTGCNVDGGG